MWNSLQLDKNLFYRLFVAFNKTETIFAGHPLHRIVKTIISQIDWKCLTFGEVIFPSTSYPGIPFLSPSNHGVQFNSGIVCLRCGVHILFITPLIPFLDPVEIFLMEAMATYFLLTGLWDSKGMQRLGRCIMHARCNAYFNYGFAGIPPPTPPSHTTALLLSIVAYYFPRVIKFARPSIVCEDLGRGRCDAKLLVWCLLR